MLQSCNHVTVIMLSSQSLLVFDGGLLTYFSALLFTVIFQLQSVSVCVCYRGKSVYSHSYRLSGHWCGDLPQPWGQSRSAHRQAWLQVVQRYLQTCVPVCMCASVCLLRCFSISAWAQFCKVCLLASIISAVFLVLFWVGVPYS